VIASALVPLEAAEGQPSPWNMYTQGLLILGSVVLWILLLTEKKEKRAAYGLRGTRWKTSAWITLLFLALYILRAVLFAIIDGEIALLLANVRSPQAWIMLGVLLPNYFLVFSAFFGEEYGWRYYLQPVLQKKMGLTRGVLALGLIWGLWHLPISFFYYTSPSSGVISLAAQIITCVALGIFFGWAYLKTGNIWLTVILHYANNNLVPVISGNYSANVLQNQEIFWYEVGYSLIIDGLLFMVFLCSKYFRSGERRNY
jgi:membrane protease YdiL (CAAX protease family)